MRKLIIGSLLATLAGVAAGGPAVAGVGDVNAHVREMNAICERQRRGEGPLSPNMCLPEYPPASSDRNRAQANY